MRNLFVSSLALAVLAAPSVAFADQQSDARTAIALCRAEVAQQAGVELEQARFDKLRIRARHVRVDIDLWRDGRLQNVRCDVSRGGEQLSIAEIRPAIGTATASAE